MSDTVVDRVPSKKLVNQISLLDCLNQQPGCATRATNQWLAAQIGLTLDKDRIQNRRLNETLSNLRQSGYITVTREDPHPVLSPAGRVITLTEKGKEFLASRYNV
jgi:DNA-binding HxlR family transcriptional regulator